MVNRLLDRKLRRDLWRQFGSLAAIAVVIGCGLAAFVSMRTMVVVLSRAQASYYEVSRFPDVFAQVRRAPDAAAQRLRALPGVAQLETRATGELLVCLPRGGAPATARIVGLGPAETRAMNVVLLRSGRLPQPGEADALTVSEGFAVANGLAPGDTLGAVVAGRWQRLRVVGIGISAEFVYELRPGDMLPDPTRYGVLWADASLPERAFGLEGAWNDLAIAVATGTDRATLLEALDHALEPYGTSGAYGRDLHVSHRFLSEEIRQNRAYATILPAIFLAVAAFLVHLVLGRVVARQRDQIGTLKAFGIPTRQLVRHYVLLALVPTFAGCLIGFALGFAVADYLVALYQEFFRFPELTPSISPSVLVTAVAIGVAASLLGALGAVRRILLLPPAEAMRPEPPAVYAAGLVERLFGPHGHPLPRMVARGVLHRPWRSALSAIGVAMGAAVVVVGSFGFDSIDRMREVLFLRSSTADATVVFTEPRGPEVRAALAGLAGVRAVELTRDVAVRVRHAHRVRTTGLVLVDPDAALRRVVDLRGRPARLAGDGLTLSAALARTLRAYPGDTLAVEVLEGRRRAVMLPVVGVVDDLSGSNAYLPLALGGMVLGPGGGFTGADLQVDAEALPSVLSMLAEAPDVRSVTSRAALRDSFNATIQRNFWVVLVTLVTIAAALAAGTLYNAGRVTLDERSRDLASLRVLGFTQREVRRVLFSELALLMAVGIPIGIGLGIGLAWWTVQSFGENELFRMPLVIGSRMLLAGAVIPTVAGVLSAWALRRRLDRTDLIASLKTRE